MLLSFPAVISTFLLWAFLHAWGQSRCSVKKGLCDLTCPLPSTLLTLFQFSTEVNLDYMPELRNLIILQKFIIELS